MYSQNKIKKIHYSIVMQQNASYITVAAYEEINRQMYKTNETEYVTTCKYQIYRDLQSSYLRLQATEELKCNLCMTNHSLIHVPSSFAFTHCLIVIKAGPASMGSAITSTTP